jgi:hypothetical protein
MCGKTGGMFLVLLAVGGLASLSPPGQSATLREARKPDGQTAAQPAPRMPVVLKTRKDFSSDDDYGKYVKEALGIGQRIRALVDYEKVKKGMRGTYFGTNEGTPPCLVMWDDDLKSGSVLLENFPKQQASHAYWIYWHQVDLRLD